MSDVFGWGLQQAGNALDQYHQRQRAQAAANQEGDYVQSLGQTPAQPAPNAALPQPQGQASSPLPSIASVQGTPSGSGVGDMLNSLNAQYGLPPGYLTKTAGLESNFNQNAYNKGSGAAGPFQFIPSTASAYGVSNPFDWADSARGAAQLASDNAKTLAQGLGRAPTAGELYLAHQQGAGGALALLKNPNAPAGSVTSPQNVASNGGDPNMPAGAFAAKWTSRFDGGQPPQQQVASAAPASAPPQSSPYGNLSGSGFTGSAPPPSAAMAYAPGQGQAGTAGQRAIAAASPPGDPLVSVPGYPGQWNKAKIDAAPDGTDVPDDGELAKAQGSAQQGQQAPQASPFAPPGQATPSPAPAPQPQQAGQAAPQAQSMANAVPVSRANPVASPALLALIRNPDTNQIGMQLFQQQSTGKNFGFTTIGNTLVRTDPVTGAAAPVFQNNPTPSWQHYTDKTGGERAFNPQTAATLELSDGGPGSTVIPNDQAIARGIVPQGFTGVVQSDSDGKISITAPPQSQQQGSYQDVPLSNGMVQKTFLRPGQDPSQGTPIGVPYNPSNSSGQMGPTAEKLFAADNERAQNLRSSLGQLQQAMSLNPNINTGLMATGKQNINRMWTALGGDDMQSVADTSAFNSLVKQAYAGVAKAAIGGRVTNYEEKIFQSLSPDSDKSPLERQQILQQFIESKTNELRSIESNLGQMKAGTFFGTGPGGGQAPGQVSQQAQPQAPSYTPASSTSDALSQARAAIAAGADPNVVRQRLQSNGFDPGQL